MQRIINVSNRLPIKIGETITKTSGGLVSALEGVTTDFDLLWVGWPGEVLKGTPEQAEMKKKLMSEYGYLPVFLTEKEITDYYHGFSNASVWPLLHYMSTYSHFEDEWFETYQKVNQKFADIILQEAQDGDVVWVHDYHLMLLPSLLKQSNPKLKIGFFLHTPFPSYELFRCHPRRIELVQGLLGSDLIGFHTFGYLRHFRSTVLRLLGLESEVNQIVHEGRVSKIGVFPIGINWSNFSSAMSEDGYQKYLQEYRELFQDKKIVLAVERMDYTKGIPQKILSIEQFLRDHPENRENTHFIIIAVPSREAVAEYSDLKKEVESLVGKVNGKYSSIRNIPIHFINRGVQFHELCALYSLADVALVTPLMDGMNLVAKEYIACQSQKNGVLILSEFAGAVQELFNALMVNPYDISGVARSIKEALEMGEEERNELIEPMKQRVIKYDALYWAKNFVRELNSAQTSVQVVSEAKLLDEQIAKQLKEVSGKVALFLDYDGTLREFVSDPHKATITDEIKSTMDHLIAQNKYDVYIISGRRMDFLRDQFADYPFNLIAEHGYTWLPPSGEVQPLSENVTMEWKQRIIEIFDLHSLSTPGSTVEVKTSSVVWHYRKSDPEFGEWKAGELLGELTEVISNLPVEIHRGKKIVEVSSQQVSKGRALEVMLSKKDYSLALCAGDDQTDETMFRVENPKLISVKIGKGDTHAKHWVPSSILFKQFLKQI